MSCHPFSYHDTEPGLRPLHPPGHPATHTPHSPRCNPAQEQGVEDLEDEVLVHPPGQDEVVEDDEDEHGGDDGGGEGVDQLVVQLQVQVQIHRQAQGGHRENLHRSVIL